MDFSQIWRLEVQGQGAGRFCVWWGTAFWFTDAIFSLCPRMVGGERKLFGLLFIRTLYPYDLTTSNRPQPLRPSPWEKLGGDPSIQPVEQCKRKSYLLFLSPETEWDSISKTWVNFICSFFSKSSPSVQAPSASPHGIDIVREWEWGGLLPLGSQPPAHHCPHATQPSGSQHFPLPSEEANHRIFTFNPSGRGSSETVAPFLWERSRMWVAPSAPPWPNYKTGIDFLVIGLVLIWAILVPPRIWNLHRKINNRYRFFGSKIMLMATLWSEDLLCGLVPLHLKDWLFKVPQSH